MKYSFKCVAFQGLVPVVGSPQLRSSIRSSSTLILINASSREPREEERRHWKEEGIGKRRASETRKGRVARANIKKEIGMGFGLVVCDCNGHVLAATQFTESELCLREAKALA
ncbi:hypothetical protein JHK85_034084 [Glycine max]|nr:hypothetical protein JHK85_034084 [Glycine max]